MKLSRVGGPASSTARPLSRVPVLQGVGKMTVEAAKQPKGAPCTMFSRDDEDDIFEEDTEQWMEKKRAERIRELKAELAAAMQALAPFAEFARMMDEIEHVQKTPDDAVIHPGLTVGHFRKAREVLSKATP
jgi:hypothetical protein